MQRVACNKAEAAKPETAPQLRVHPAIHLCSGDMVGAFAEHAFDFDDSPRFSLGQVDLSSHTTPAKWLAEKILTLASYCDLTGMTERPIILPVPASVLNDESLVETAILAMAQTRLCHQEISFELTDAAIASSADQAEGFIRSCRKRGFRVSIDARTSQSMNMKPNMWLMIDSLRINADSICQEEALDEHIDIASQAGVAIVAQSPQWRECDYLASLGIDYGLHPRADA